jgi:tRNA 5-methylaminomethyl-2-thiouridine biosynthesis bifunctional protein
MRPFSPIYQDHYWQAGEAEKQVVYLHANQLAQRFANVSPTSRFVVAELGFGTALTYALTAHLWHRTAPQGAHLHYISTEAHPLPLAEMLTIHRTFSAPIQSFAAQANTLWPLSAGWNTHTTPTHTLHIWHGLASHMFSVPPPGLAHTWQAQAWFLDGFNPTTNPEMWSSSLLQQVAQHTSPQGTFSTYTAAGHVRRTLTSVGFTVQRVAGHGQKRHMTIGQKTSPTQST